MDVIYSNYPYGSRDEENAKKEIYLNYQGIGVRAMEEADGSYRIIQILSDNPKDFLRKDIYPGLKMKKEIKTEK